MAKALAPIFTDEISVVIFRDTDQWVAQGLEYDICVQGRTLETVQRAFDQAVFANLAVAQELGLEPLQGIEAAPQKFWDMYQQATVKVAAEPRPIRVPRSTAMPWFIPQFKVNEQYATA